tara:strand:+ start:9615 stop:9755 length:141 start_codon:yes stop_codon:yes gene_type:complete
MDSSEVLQRYSNPSLAFGEPQGVGKLFANFTDLFSAIAGGIKKLFQ